MLEYNNVTQCMETVLQQYSAVSTQLDDPFIVRFPKLGPKPTCYWNSCELVNITMQYSAVSTQEDDPCGQK